MADAPRRETTLSFTLLATCFFGSGLTALIYELLWTRRLQLTFGSTTYSVTAVLAAFMAGLGLGGYLVGRRVDRSRLGGVRIYAYLELGVGVYALASLPLLSLVELIYAALQSRLQLGHEAAAVLKLLLAFPVLAFPAAMMGGTLPALVRGCVEHRADLNRILGRLYGLNTAGAATGTALAGLVLVEHLGLWRSMLVSATVNLGIAVLVLSRLRRDPVASDAHTAPATEAPLRLRAHLSSPAVRFCAAAVTLTGLLSMLYEIVWTRLLSLVMGSSTYAFTIVLSIFLVGIAIGSLVYARASQGRAPGAFGLTLILLALALWVVVSIVVMPSIPVLFAQAAQYPGLSFSRVLLFELIFAAFVLLLPTLLLGAALPMSMGIISREVGQLGRDVGGVYLVNTLGAIVGSVLTGFVLIPLIGTQRALLGGLLANLLLVAAGVLRFAGTLQRRVAGLAVVGILGAVALAQPPWPPLVFDSGLGYRLDQARGSSRLELLARLHRHPNKLVFQEEGRNATITVRHFPRGMSLLVNGKPDASTSSDMLTQVVLGVVATLAHPAPRDVGIVGWGSGVTAFTATFFSGVQHIDVMEIEPAVVRGSRFFHPVNGQVERDPRMRLIYDDARSYFVTADRDYDVLVSEPSNPWMAGVSGLFSKDYYELARRRMRPGGVFGQWLQLYRIDSRSVALILRTVLESFPHVQLWSSDPFNVILLASDRPFDFALDRLRRAYASSRALRLHMLVYGPGMRPEHFFGCFLLDRKALERIVRRFDAEVMTDDLPVLEYRAVRRIYSPVHLHITQIWRLKHAMREILPPGQRGGSPAIALAGASTAVHDQTEIADHITRWAMQSYAQEPEVRLARAKILFRLDQYEGALEMARSIPPLPELRGEGSLLEARTLFQLGRTEESMTRLEALAEVRPTASLLYRLRSAIKLGRFDLAWTLAERLFDRLDDLWDPDVVSLNRARLYDQVSTLMTRSQQYDRGLRLLSRRREPLDGELDRIRGLVEGNFRSGRYREAALAYDELLKFGVDDASVLDRCVRIYTAAKRTDRAEECRAQLTRLREEPEGRPLWD